MITHEPQHDAQIDPHTCNSFRALNVMANPCWSADVTIAVLTGVESLFSLLAGGCNLHLLGEKFGRGDYD